MSYHLIKRILEVTKSPQSENFYRNTIKLLGEGIVDMELGELKYQINTGNVQHPGRYFTKLLQDQLNKYGKDAKKIIPKDTYQELTQQDLFKHLQPKEIPKDLQRKEKQMPHPYFRGQIPFPTFIGHEFFTLSSNKKRADTVIYKTETADRKQIEIILIRGKITPKGKSRGISTVYHGRLFVALIKAWTEGDSDFFEHKDSTKLCFVRVSARQLAQYLGWEGFGGSKLTYLKNSLEELRSYPYYFQLEELDIGLKGFGFYLIGDFRIIDTEKERTAETIFEVVFSSTVSWQLLNRHTVTRSDELISIRNEIGWKLRLYLEPRLIALRDNYFNINLKNLIKELQLPKAGWHKFKSQRKREFLKAAKESNNSKITDKRTIKINIGLNKDKSDYKLSAFLKDLRQMVLIK